jgi:hypothetical protein
MDWGVLQALEVVALAALLWAMFNAVSAAIHNQREEARAELERLKTKREEDMLFELRLLLADIRREAVRRVRNEDRP